jgi:5-formyltetrahydrofolate cyclo-ligase
MILDKQSLRITCRKVRAQIVNKEDQSQAIISKLLSFPAVIKAGSLLAYYPLENEIGILPLLSKLERDHKKIYIPFFKQLKIGLFNNSLNNVDN